jgi:hypothetical protein
MGREVGDEHGKDVQAGQEIQPGPHRLAGRADHQEETMQKVLQALRAQQKQCTESAEEMPQGLQMRCARIIRVLSDLGPSSLFFSVIWPSTIKSFIIKSFIIKSFIIKSFIIKSLIIKSSIM